MKMANTGITFVLTVVHVLVCITLVVGYVPTNDGNGVFKQNEVCFMKRSNSDCLDRAGTSVGGMGAWRKQSKLDKYVRGIIDDARKMLKSKSCNFYLRRSDLEVYTQVVAGLNICINTRLVQKSCNENSTKMCQSPSNRCSILIYKPPGRAPIEESNIDIYCD